MTSVVPLRFGRWSQLAAGLVLFGAILLQAMPLVRSGGSAPDPGLAARIPTRPFNWTSREVPLGPSEFMVTEVEKVLNFDEMINRDYHRGSDHFGIYIAYWRAGKMPTQLVASHTPDRCWTENGWHCLEMRFRQTEIFTGITLPRVEWRLFEPPQGGTPTHVVFWHLVGGEPYDYGERFNAVPDPVRWWRDAMHTAFQGGREQYFIRVTSDQPLEQLQSDEGFNEILRSIAELTRFASAQAGATH